jgi:branched-chain amino acid transport system substrate-binding protein
MTLRQKSMVLVLACALLAGCGGHLTDAEVLAASGARSDANGASGTVPGGELADATTLAGDEATASGQGGPAAQTSAGGAAGKASGPAGRAAAGTVGTPGETGPILVGNVGTYSGPAGASTAGIPKALQVWAASVNKRGGLFGRQVQVIVQDDGGDPARFASAVQNLVENRKVITFVGESSLGFQGGVDYLEKKGVPVIGTDCSNAVWYGSPVFFPQCAPINVDTAGLGLKAAVQITGKRKLGLVYCSETPVCTDGDKVLVEAAGRQGVEVVYNASISLAQVDFTANCQAAKDRGAELFGVLGDANTVSRFSRSCVRQNFRPQYVQPSITVTGDTAATPGLENMILSLQTFPFAGASSPAFTEFTQAMATFAPNETIGPASSYGWAAAKLFQLAANKAAAATQSLSSRSLLDAMRTVKGETLGGLTVALDFTGPKPNNAPCGFVMQANGGGWRVPVGAGPFC